MQTPLVSVVMTTYNHAPYLRQAIEGVLAQQTPFDVELVLGEDCSTDATPAICREYVERYPGRVRLVTGPANVGWRANYRRTFEACRGRYVAYCDGDDWWEDPHKLRRQVERLESDLSCGLCYTRTERCDQTTGVRTPFPAECSTRFDRMVFRNPVDNCCAVARRELVARYYAEVRPEEHPEWLTDDQPMWLWCALHAGVCFVDAVTAVHRVLPASVSHSGLYRRRIAFVDSLCDIGLWMDARYHGGRCRRRLLRKRSSDALWVLSYHGGVGEYLARWWCDVRRTPWLLLCPEGYGLLVKKLLFRRNTDTR